MPTDKTVIFPAPGSMSATVTIGADGRGEEWLVAASMCGIARITQERLWQVMEKGHAPEHDDRVHAGGDLLDFASEILFGVMVGDHTLRDQLGPAAPWWEREARHVLTKHKDRVDRLAIVGALVAAEIDRLERAKAKGVPADGK